MREFYEAELRQLRKAAHEFAVAHPEIASALNLTDTKYQDPSVERLLEGFAYLTGRVRQHMAHDMPEMTEALLRDLAPQLLQPFPSATILQFSALPGAVQSKHTIAAGAEVASGAVGPEHTRCKFQTCFDLDLFPLELIDISSGSGSQATELKLKFSVPGSININQLDLRRLPFYINTDGVFASTLVHALVENVESISISTDNESKDSSQLQQANFRVKTDWLETSLLPQEKRCQYPFYIWQDYFCFPEKLQFVELNGLESITWPQQCESFTLTIRFNSQCLDLNSVKSDCLRLYCVPAINLFLSDAEPIKLDNTQYEYRIVPDASHRNSVWLHEVSSVIGSDIESAQQYHYASLQSHQRMTAAGCYNLAYEQHVSQTPQLNISFSGQHTQHQQYVSISCLASNGQYPHQYLVAGSIKQTGKDLPNWCQVTNITQPSKILLPPKRQAYQWYLMGYMGLHWQSISSVEQLQSLLDLYNWTELPYQAAKIRALTDIQLSPVVETYRSVVRRGVECRISVDDRQFSSEADVYLFGILMQLFLSHYAELNTFVKTHIYCQVSQRELRWQASSGCKPTL